MQPNADQSRATFVAVDAREQKGQVESCGGDKFKLRRWLASFASG